MIKQLLVPLVFAVVVGLAGSAAAAEPEVHWRETPGGPGEITVSGTVVIRIRMQGSGFGVAERSAIIADRLDRALSNTNADIRPVTLADGEVAVAVGSEIIVFIQPEDVLAAGTDAWRLALVWANNIRQTLDLEPLDASGSQVRLIDLGRGLASWYGPGFDGKRTASGEVFRSSELTAAHRTLPMGTLVRVMSPDTGRTVTVRINDRGPFIGGRVIDLSYQAARVLGIVNHGVAPVRMWAVESL